MNEKYIEVFYRDISRINRYAGTFKETMPVQPSLTLKSIHEAAVRIAPFVKPTPLVRMLPSDIMLKVESLHPAGAFKIRGAFNAILSLTETERARGVVAHSAGNHAMAVAFAAHALGARAVIVMPNNAPAAKRAGVARFHGEIVEVGPNSDERAARAGELAAEFGYILIEPFDAPEIVRATGTISLEILADMPDVEAVYVPVSGGGLIAGVALAMKLTAPHVRIIGVEPEVAADAYQSWIAGRRVALPAEMMVRTIADGLRVNQIGDYCWPLFQEYVDEVVTVPEAAIRDMMGMIARQGRLIAEPSGAVAAAGALAFRHPDEQAVAILTGGNCDPEFLDNLSGGVKDN